MVSQLAFQWRCRSVVGGILNATTFIHKRTRWLPARCGIATRYDKLALTYGGGAVLRVITIWLKELGDTPYIKGWNLGAERGMRVPLGARH